MPKVKICGNTNPKDAWQAKEIGADFLGLIFTTSKRQVSLEQARQIIEAVPEFEQFVGVFANQPKEQVLSMVQALGLKWVQFHGTETSRYCDYFTELGLNVIKSFRIRDEMSLKRIGEYNVTAFLFDTFSREFSGGTGTSFDWSILEGKPYVHEKLFLAGGLTVDNLETAIRQVQPYAVDVVSGVEKSPGIKDESLLEQFIAVAKGRAAHRERKGPRLHADG